MSRVRESNDDSWSSPGTFRGDRSRGYARLIGSESVGWTVASSINARGRPRVGTWWESWVDWVLIVETNRETLLVVRGSAAYLPLFLSSRLSSIGRACFHGSLRRFPCCRRAASPGSASILVRRWRRAWMVAVVNRLREIGLICEEENAKYSQSTVARSSPAILISRPRDRSFVRNVERKRKVVATDLERI